MSLTVIPAHATVDGLIDTPGDVIIEGRVEGDVKAGGTVTIAAAATCKASVLCRGVLIYGELIGNAVCTETIEVARGARVVGDLRAPNVAVAAGCEVDGRVDLLPPEPGGHRLPLQPGAVPTARAPTPVPEATLEATQEFEDLATREHTNEISEQTPAIDASEVSFRRPVPRMPRPAGRGRMTQRNR